MSALVDSAIAAAGFADVLAARSGAGVSSALRARLEGADLLVLGALADRVRREEVGPEVRVYVGDAPMDDPSIVVLPPEGVEMTGLDLLREVAVARIAGAKRARVRVDWARTGLELAQVALGFGADELVGFIATKRGLPIADGQLAGVGKKSRRELATVVKRKELSDCIRRSGREPVFVEENS